MVNLGLKGVQEPEKNLNKEEKSTEKSTQFSTKFKHARRKR